MKMNGSKHGTILSIRPDGNQREIIFSDDRHNQYSVYTREELDTLFPGDSIQIGGKMYALVTNSSGETRKISRTSWYRKIA